jgi:DNA-binding transcriptional regulator YhcF (GntR family)
MHGNESRYKLIVNYVIERVKDGTYHLGDRLPSVNEFRKLYDLARSTVFVALNELRLRNIIDSSPGVGYFITGTDVFGPKKILLLFNEMNSFKEELYNCFMANIGTEASVDLMFHNYNRRLFDSILNEANGKYTTYVVMPGKFERTEPLLRSLDGEVLLLDHIHKELTGKFSVVFQNFGPDTYMALSSETEHFKKYKRIIMVQRHEKEPIERYYGLIRFCRDNSLGSALIATTRGRTITPGEVYIVVDDRDLVYLIKRAEEQGLAPGKEFGIIACNDTLLREAINITTLSTDFCRMGRTIASLIGQSEITTVNNPCKLTIRSSI